MTKAYDLKALGESIIKEAKKEGLEIAEEALESLGKAVYFGTQNWARESAILSDTKVDDFVMPFYSQIDQFVLPQIEKLDLDNSGN